MPTISSANIPSPKSWDEFEDITLSALQVRWSTDDLTRHGRQGQRQDGVDIYGTNSRNEFVGIQCKNTVDGVSKKVVQEECKAAESFSPPIQRLYIATTAARDVALQEFVREENKTRSNASKFEITILFWNDIASDLSGDERRFFKHYPQFGQRKNPQKERDKKLFERLLKLLPSNGVIAFLRDNNMADFSFESSRLDPIREFNYEWSNAEHEFVDTALENKRAELLARCDRYLEIIADNTWSVPSNVDRRSVPQEWETEQPQRFKKVVGELHALAKEIVEIHQSIVRYAQRELLQA